MTLKEAMIRINDLKNDEYDRYRQTGEKDAYGFVIAMQLASDILLGVDSIGKKKNEKWFLDELHYRRKADGTYSKSIILEEDE